MTSMLERSVPSGFVEDPEQLMSEMLGAVDLITSSCIGVGVSPLDAPNNDTIWLTFDDPPVEAQVDIVLAAHVSGSGDYAWPDQVAATAGTWHDIVKIPIEPSSHVEIDIAVKIRIGTANDFGVARIYFDNIARRRGAGDVVITDALGLERPYGDIPKYSFRLRPAGFSAQLQMRVQRTADVVFEDRRIEIERTRVA